MSAFSTCIEAANALLKLVRGDAVNPERLLADARADGCEVTAEGGNLRVSGKLSDDLRAKLKANKAALLRVLAEAPTPAGDEFDFWVPEEALSVCDLLRKRLDRQGWPDTDELRSEAARCMDAIDAAYGGRNLAAFSRAARRFVDFLDAQPHQLGGTVRYGAAADCGSLWTGWVRAGKKQPWLPIARDVASEQECDEFINDYAAEFKHLDVMVLPNGKDPNEKAVVK